MTIVGRSKHRSFNVVSLLEKPGRGLPGAMENTGCRGLWKTRGARDVENTG